MMYTSGADQEAIQMDLANASPEDRRSGMEAGHELLASLRMSFLQDGGLNEMNERAAALTIETIVRAECMESGRGAWYRASRRIALVRQYFKP